MTKKFKIIFSGYKKGATAYNVLYPYTKEMINQCIAGQVLSCINERVIKSSISGNALNTLAIDYYFWGRL